MPSKSIAGLLVLVLLLAPMSVQNASAQVAEGTAQAETDTNATLWMGAGCLLGILGYALAYLMVPSPPASALLGKDPTFVAQYTDAYKERAKKIQTSKALTGCLIGTAVQVAAYVLIFAVAESTY